MITVALCNQKGGVGKSTTTFHLARAAALQGLRTLVVDMDPQGNISAALSKDTLRDDAPGVADALSERSRETLASIIIPTIWEKVDLAPTVGEALAVVRDELIVAGAGREGRLTTAVFSVEVYYDLVLIDCPPSLDQLTINSLVASDRLLIISQSKQWSTSGLAHLLATIAAVQTYYSPSLQVAGIVINQHDAQTRSGTHWLSEVHHAAQINRLEVLDPPIPKRVVIADSVEASVGIDEYPEASPQLVDIYSSILERTIS